MITKPAVTAFIFTQFIRKYIWLLELVSTDRSVSLSHLLFNIFCDVLIHTSLEWEQCWCCINYGSTLQLLLPGIHYVKRSFPFIVLCYQDLRWSVKQVFSVSSNQNSNFPNLFLDLLKRHFIYLVYLYFKTNVYTTLHYTRFSMF